MKSLATIAANTPVRRGSNPMLNSQPALSTEAASHINLIFSELKAAFPAWKQAFPTAEDLAAGKRTWTKALLESGISDLKLIQCGLRRARASECDFFPSAGKFISWCKPTPEDCGLPDQHEAFKQSIDYLQAAKRHQVNPVVAAAVKSIGFADYRVMTERDARKTFNREYTICVQRFMDGEDFSAHIPKALPSEIEPTQAVRDRRRKAGLAWIQKLKQGTFDEVTNGN